MAKLILPGYEVIEKIASGGMGAIWSAYSPTRELRAVKVLHPGLAEDPAFHSMLLREAMVVAHLEHDNICRFYTFGKTPLGELYLEMEFIDGITLSALRQKSRQQGIQLPLELCCQIVQGICVGLGYAHQQVSGLIHRDISPQNAMVSRDGKIKILDFGVAKLTQQLENTQPGTIKGKTSYMSPEQLCGETLDHRSDLFSLGIVLWELLTGKRLFKADNAGGAAASMFLVLEGQHKPYPSPSSLRSGVPASLDQITMKALAYTPQDRYQDCEAMQADLARWLAERPPSSMTSFLEEYIYGQDQTETSIDVYHPLTPTSSALLPASHWDKTVSRAEPIEATSPIANHHIEEITTPLPSSPLDAILETAPPPYEETISYAHSPGRSQPQAHPSSAAAQPQNSNTAHSISLRPKHSLPALVTSEPVLLLTLPAPHNHPMEQDHIPGDEHHPTYAPEPMADPGNRWLWGFVLVCVLLGGGMYWLLTQRNNSTSVPALSPLQISEHQPPQGYLPRQGARPQSHRVTVPPPPDRAAGMTAALPSRRAHSKSISKSISRSSSRKRRKRRRKRRYRTSRKSKRSAKQVPKVPPLHRDTSAVNPLPDLDAPSLHRCSKDAKWLQLHPNPGSPSFQGLRITLQRRTFRFNGSAPAFCILKHIQRITIAPANPSQRKQYWPCTVPILGKHTVFFSLSDIRGMPNKTCYSVR